ncbi:MAG: hypothetical protein ACRCXT_18895, partial [Paraclostridium sp.]
MGIQTIGIIVKNDRDNILYHKDNFFIEMEINKDDSLRFVIKDKLNGIFGKHTFRVDTISKKLPKLKLLGIGTTDGIPMYLVTVYMYNDDSKFLPRESLLHNLDTSLYKDYYVKYLIRYNKYRNLVDLYIGIMIYLFLSVTSVIFPTEVIGEFILDSVFNSFLFTITIYIIVPLFIIYKFIVPSITNYLVQYDIRKKIFKVSK